jgi:hypothetical protein
VEKRPTLRGKTGCAGSSPGNPLGDAPVPMIAGHHRGLAESGSRLQHRAFILPGGAYDDDF